jgi:hypothetical protein
MMALFERFKDESEFRDAFIKPLLNRLGFYGVSEQHGTQEFGKDFVFSELHRLGGMRHFPERSWTRLRQTRSNKTKPRHDCPAFTSSWTFW